MPGLTVDVEWLEGIDLENTPPCESEFEHRNFSCGLPSVARVTATCGTCGTTRTKFKCAKCMDAFRSGNMGCSFCLSVNWISWKVI